MGYFSKVKRKSTVKSVQEVWAQTLHYNKALRLTAEIKLRDLVSAFPSHNKNILNVSPD